MRKTGYTSVGASARTATMTAMATHNERVESDCCTDDSEVSAMAAYFCVPKRPAGLISSTMAMMTKMTVLEASG